MNLFDLTGKNAMIVGGAGGLGKLVAQAFAEAGANVAIASRTEEKLKAACEELKGLTGKEFKYYVMDAGKEDQVEACLLYTSSGKVQNGRALFHLPNKDAPAGGAPRNVEGNGISKHEFSGRL